MYNERPDAEVESYEAAKERIGNEALRAVEAASGDRAATKRAIQRAQLAILQVDLVYADGPDAELDQKLAKLLGSTAPAPRYTGSLDAARDFVRQALPGFWVVSGLREVTGHCSLGPDDGSGQHWNVELEPGDGPHRECYAILSCALQALAARGRQAH